jgi:hypothetical protein
MAPKAQKVKKVSLITIAILFILAIFLIGKYIYPAGNNFWQKYSNEVNGVPMKQKTVRKPVAAGSFYSADKKILSQQIKSFLEQAGDEEINGNLQMLILPHAGYDYSGQTAAYGFEQLVGQNFKTIILIGPSHQDWFFGAALTNQDYWQTPLGEMNIDKDLAKKLIQENKNIFIREQAHQNEHCLEVMLPFLQKVLKDFSVSGGKILPIIVSQTDDKFLTDLAQALQKHLTEEDLVIISSDLSHYPSYNDAQKADKNTINGILSGSVEIFEKSIQENMQQNLPNLDTCACGEAPIKVGLLLAKTMGWDKIELLNYTNSGNVSGDRSRVVGYASIVFSSDKQREGELFLSSEEKQILLKIARQSIENKKNINNGNLTERLKQPQGAFVTLNKDGQLRGCMGRIIEEKKPLYQVVEEMAKVAAFEDPRFYPVSEEETKEIEIEISVLSPLKKIIDPFKEIEIGKHGVIVSARGGSAFGGQKGGVFLPQVAVENNWDLETFMNELCENKAGLTRDAWKGGDVDIYIFSAEVFGE